MTLAGLLLFSAAYIMAVASPGPGVAAVLARVLGRGLAGIVPFIAGFVAGDLVWFAVAATGLAVLAQTFEALFLAIKYAGAAYLLYLAFKLWTAPVRPAEIEGVAPAESGVKLFLAGLSITLGNPKVIVFFLALLPTVVDLGSLSLLGLAEIAALITVILSSVLGAYALLAARARRLFTSTKAIRLLNRGTGAVMASAAAAIAAR